MSFSALTTGLIFALQTGVGILGNIFLLSCYVFMPCTGQRLKDIDFILNNLILAICFVLLSRGIPGTMLYFGMKNFLDDFGCKVVFYIHRVAREVSLGATCILSCFQAIKISPSSPQWMKIKAAPVRFTRFSITFCWILHMLTNSVIIKYIKGPRRSSNHTTEKDYGYCSSIKFDRNTAILRLMIFSSIDMLSLGCMVSASGFVMLVLYKHKQNVLYIHTKIFSSKSSAETRATQCILTLACIFFCFYALSSFFTFYMSHCVKPSLWLVDTSSLMAVSFPCLCPFVLLSRDPRVSRLCSTCCAKVNHFYKLSSVL